MSAQANQNRLTPAKRRWLIGLGLLRALATAAALVALYYLLPLNHVQNVPVTLLVGLLILVAVVLVQLRLITKARYPVVRAIEALAATVPLFLLPFVTAVRSGRQQAASAANPGVPQVQTRQQGDD